MTILKTPNATTFNFLCSDDLNNVFEDFLAAGHFPKINQTHANVNAIIINNWLNAKGEKMRINNECMSGKSYSSIQQW